MTSPLPNRLVAFTLAAAVMLAGWVPTVTVPAASAAALTAPAAAELA